MYSKLQKGTYSKITQLEEKKLIEFTALSEEQMKLRDELLEEIKIARENENLTTLDYEALKECSFVPSVNKTEGESMQRRELKDFLADQKKHSESINEKIQAHLEARMNLT